MKKIIVTLPAYNEEKELESLISAWQELRNVLESEHDLDLIITIINDGSKDNTEKIALALQNKYDNVFLVNHIRNMGLGMALKTCCLNTIHNYPDADYMLLMDCDNTHRPEYTMEMIKKQRSGNVDIVIASRYCGNSSIKGLSKIREFMSEGAKVIYSILLNVKNVKDYTCGYRLYKLDIIKKAEKHFGDDFITQSNFSCMVELLYKLYFVGATFAEVPFELRYDLKQGDSKMKVVKTAINSLKLAFKLKKLYNK